MRKTLITFAALLGLATAAGCADNPPVAEDSSPAPVATVAQGEEPAAEEDPEDPGEAARLYIEALASHEPQTMRDGLEYAAEGSTAHAYLTHQTAVVEAALDGGLPIDAYDLAPTGDGFELCDPYGTGDEACSVFADFQATNGLLSDLTVDGQEPGPRLTVGAGEAVKDSGVRAEFLTAYKTVTDSGLWVTVRVASGDQPVDLWLYDATYRAPGGGQRQATDAYGPIELGADSSATVALIFAGVEPGGTVTLDGTDSETYLTEFELKIKVG